MNPETNQNSSSQSNQTGSIAETRSSGRTYGFIGLSMMMHAAFLTVLAFAPQSVRELGGDMGSTGKKGSDDSLSVVEASSAPSENPVAMAMAAMSKAASGQTAATDQSVDASVMTDDQSDIEVPVSPKAKALSAKVETKPEVKAEQKIEDVKPLPVKAAKKSVAKKTKPVKAAGFKDSVTETDDAVAETTNDPVLETQDESPVETAEETKEEKVATPVVTKATKQADLEDEPAPTLLANPPSDEELTEKAKPAKKLEPVVAAKPATTKTAAPANDSAVATTKPSATNVAATAAESVDGETAPANGTAAMAAATATTNANGANGGSSATGDGAGSGTSTSIGPIRDASELRALPGNPNPIYPPRDRLARKQGTAVILGRVTPDGRVAELTVERSSGSQQMDNASMQAFRSWRFQPGQQGWVRKPFQFRLVGEATEVPAPLGQPIKR